MLIPKPKSASKQVLVQTHVHNTYSHMHVQVVPSQHLTLSVREPYLCLCKQVGSRPAAELARDPTCLLTQSIIPNEKLAEFKGFNKQTTT